MPIIAKKKPQEGNTFKARIDDPSMRIGNAISIFFEGARVALGRVVENVGTNEKYTSTKYVDPRRNVPVNSQTNMAKNIWGVRVEHVFGEKNDE